MAKLTLIYEETQEQDGVDTLIMLQKPVYDLNDLVYAYVDSTKAFGFDYVNQVEIKSKDNSWSNDW